MRRVEKTTRRGTKRGLLTRPRHWGTAATSIGERLRPVPARARPLEGPWSRALNNALTGYWGTSNGNRVGLPLPLAVIGDGLPMIPKAGLQPLPQMLGGFVSTKRSHSGVTRRGSESVGEGWDGLT
jgi:hypothetical protein